jgi:hypothetical protein
MMVRIACFVLIGIAMSPLTGTAQNVTWFQAGSSDGKWSCERSDPTPNDFIETGHNTDCNVDVQNFGRMPDGTPQAIVITLTRKDNSNRCLASTLYLFRELKGCQSFLDTLN